MFLMYLYMVMASRYVLKPLHTRKVLMSMRFRMIPSWGRFAFLKRGEDWVLMSLRSEASWLGTRMEVFWKTSIGRTMACGGLTEEPYTARDRILPAMLEDPPMGLVPTPKECRTRIMLDFGILIISTTGLFSA